MKPSADELARMARKYRFLGELRRDKARDGTVPHRRVFRDLAAEFPGALNELDMLPLEIIDARADALERAARGRGRGPQARVD